MAQLPDGCRVRYEAMEEVANELLDSFRNGNRNSTRDRLKEYDTIPALGIFSVMMQHSDSDMQWDLIRYFKEVA